MAAEHSEHRLAPCMCIEHEKLMDGCIHCTVRRQVSSASVGALTTAASADCEPVGKENETDEMHTQPDDGTWGSLSWLSTAGDSGSAASRSSRSRRRRRNTGSTVAHRLHTALCHCNSNIGPVFSTIYSPSSEYCYLRVECGSAASTKSEPAPQRSAESVYCDARLQAHSWGGSEYMHKDKGHRRRTSTDTDTPHCPNGKCARVQCASATVGSESSTSTSHYRKCNGCYSHSGTGSVSLAVCAAQAAAAMLLSVESVVADVRSVRRLAERNGASVGELSDAMRTFFTTVATATAAGTEHKRSQ